MLTHWPVNYSTTGIHVAPLEEVF